MLRTLSGMKLANRHPFLPSWAKTAPAKTLLALLIGIGLGAGPAIVLSAPAGPPIDKLPEAAQNVLGGNGVALVRVVKKDSSIVAFANRNSPPEVKEEPPKVNFTGYGPVPTGASHIDVTATIPKEVLGNPQDPMEVLSISVVVRAGSGTCIWDCYWSNGRKICGCVNI